VDEQLQEMQQQLIKELQALKIKSTTTIDELFQKIDPSYTLQIMRYIHYLPSSR